jgi:hypothetical protein
MPLTLAQTLILRSSQKAAAQPGDQAVARGRGRPPHRKMANLQRLRSSQSGRG